jgi:hypothetical protein
VESKKNPALSEAQSRIVVNKRLSKGGRRGIEGWSMGTKSQLDRKKMVWGSIA